MSQDIREAQEAVRQAIAELRAAGVPVPIALMQALGALNFALKVKAAAMG